VEADRFVIIAPKDGLSVNKDNLDYLVLSYLAEYGEEGDATMGSE
jgi:hypothetical protein